MGILTLLRNAFGRSRKAKSAEAEGAAPAAEATETAAPTTPNPSATATVPEQRESDEHDLVRSAFDKVEVPRPAQSSETEQKPTASDTEPETPPVPEETPEAKAPTEPEAAEPAAEPEEPTEPEAQPKADEPEVKKPEAEATPEPEATPEATPEPAAEAKPEPTPEPEAEAKPEPEPTPEAEAKPEPEQEAKPEVEATAEAEPEAEAKAKAEPAPKVASEPEATAEPEAKEEPEAKAEPAPAPESAPEASPAAADGEQVPQGPPAPDDGTRTGGAGGNENPAEGEAEAQGPATPASALRDTPLTTAYKAAGTVLDENNLTGTRAKIHLVLDRSASMRPYYKDGSAQALGEQTLALAAHLDTDATVHVTFFSTELDGTGELTLTEHENKIDELHAGLGRMGRTSYHAAVEAVLEQHAKEPAGTPALVIFQTDGAPDAKTPATKALTDAAKNHPNVFFSFVAFGEHDNKAFDYLRKLKTDNTAFFHAGPTPRELTDKELYEGVLANWRP